MTSSEMQESDEGGEEGPISDWIESAGVDQDLLQSLDNHASPGSLDTGAVLSQIHTNADEAADEAISQLPEVETDDEGGAD